MTTTDININSADYRTRPRTFLHPCDLCEQRAGTLCVHRIEGPRVITAIICRECRAVWEEQGR